LEPKLYKLKILMLNYLYGIQPAKNLLGPLPGLIIEDLYVQSLFLMFAAKNHSIMLNNGLMKLKNKAVHKSNASWLEIRQI